ncbi:MAG: type II toxin-antitoxin system VapC family toxin [Nitrospirae bacterium]|nr:type II toxin-antitoxin system VapC family toxin [Nitrospirota bacterium]
MKPSKSVSSVLDASAILAYLGRESGFERVQAALRAGAAVSTVNLSEAMGKVVEAGFDPVQIASRLTALGLIPHDFTQADALTVAQLRLQTRSLGLALGDRACMALGRRLGLPVLTADRIWQRGSFGVRVVLIS